MAKKGQKFQVYTDEFKLKAVMAYVNGSKGYKALALNLLAKEELNIEKMLLRKRFLSLTIRKCHPNLAANGSGT